MPGEKVFGSHVCVCVGVVSVVPETNLRKKRVSENSKDEYRNFGCMHASIFCACSLPVDSNTVAHYSLLCCTGYMLLDQTLYFLDQTL